MPGPGAATGFRVASARGQGPRAEAAVETAMAEVEASLGGRADLAVAFLGSAYGGSAELLAARLAQFAATSVGVSAQGVVAGAREYERPDALTLWAAHLPGVTHAGLRYAPPATSADQVVAWPPPPPDSVGMLAFCDPYAFPAEPFLAWLQDEVPGLAVSGGLASGGRLPGDVRLLLDGDVHTDGAVTVALGGGLRLHGLVSQGCRPLGPAFVVTSATGNVVHELAGSPAFERVREVFAAADAGDRELLRGGLLVGILLDEHAEDPGTGDFLVRGVLGAEPGGGGLVVGAAVEVGRTVRFHVRDAASADEDLCTVLSGVAGREASGGLLFTCNGRGRGLFGRPDHDAELASAALGGAPLAGFFAAGEFGPVGGRSWLHGFTASLLVLEPPDAGRDA